MSSYSSLISVSPGEQIGGYADQGDDDDMAAAANYLSSFCFDFGDEYSVGEAATASYPLHGQQQQAPTKADSHHSGQAASITSSQRFDNINTSLTSSDARSKGSKIAFKTRSEVEVLDDGYRWRKYGKKMVKNSPNPRYAHAAQTQSRGYAFWFSSLMKRRATMASRNYYRCSSEGCRVKKRVERDRDDERFVITTYDGVHNHLAPLPPQGCAGYSLSLAQTRVDEGSSPLPMEGRRCFLDAMKMHAAGSLAGSSPVPAPRTLERHN
ncbi:WRKY transcription factor 5 [Hordeum vulgare]|nr:WRKY transcription factor 5 [Hordeum vulgare]